MGACNSHEMKLSSDLACCTTRRQDSTPSEKPDSKHTIALAATQLFSVVGITAYHTSIVVDDMELFFDGGGIVLADAFWSHEWSLGIQSLEGSAIETEVLQLGTTTWHVANAIDMLGPFFQDGSYDVLRKNCNSFSDAAIYLLTGRNERLDARFNRLERWVLACEPVSINLIRRLIQREAKEQDSTLDAPADETIPSEEAGTVEPRYVPNPLAAEFKIEDVIAEIDLANATRANHPPEQSWLACCRSNNCHDKSTWPPGSTASEDAQLVLGVNKIWDPIIEHSPKTLTGPIWPE